MDKAIPSSKKKSKEVKKSKESSEAEIVGIGTQLDVRDGKLYIIKPLPGGPAHQSGILHGDRILEINALSTEKMAIEDVIAKIRGPKGSHVFLTIKRKGEKEKRIFTIVRDKITLKTKKKPSTKEKPQALSAAKIPTSLMEESKPKGLDIRDASSAKKTTRKQIKKKSTQRLKKKTQKLIKIIFDEEKEEQPKSPESTASIEAQDFFQDLDHSSAVSTDSFEDRLAGMQEESLQEAEIEDEAEIEIENLNLALAQETGETGSFKKATQRLKKATQRLKKKTGRIVKTLFEHMEEEDDDDDKENTRQISLSEEIKNSLFKDEGMNKIDSLFEEKPPPKKITQRIKKASQHLVKIFYDEPDAPKAKPKKKKEAAANVSYWYRVGAQEEKDEDEKIQEDLDKYLGILKEDAKELSAEERERARAKSRENKKAAQSSFSAKKAPPKKGPPKKQLDTYSNLKENYGPEEGGMFKFIVIGFSLFLFFLWSLGLFPEKKPKVEVAKQKSKARRPVKKERVPKKEKANEKVEYGTQAKAIRPQLSPEEEKLLRLQEEILDIYYKESTENEKAIRTLLARYDLEPKDIDRFPKEELGELNRDEFTLLIEFQQKKEIFTWVIRESRRYNNFQFKNRSKIETQRKRFLSRKEEIAPGLLSALSNPNFSINAHQEIAYILGASEDTRAFEPVLHFYLNELILEKKVHLMVPLAKLGKSKARKYLLEALKANNEKEKSMALSLFSEVIQEGDEEKLAPFLDEFDKKMVENARRHLINLNTPRAREILEEALAAGKIKSTSLKK